MKELFIACFLTIITLTAFAQERIAIGYVLDADSRLAVAGARVSVGDTIISTLTDEGGAFSIEVPKRRRYLLVTRESYNPLIVRLKPGFRHRPLRILIQSGDYLSKKKDERDSLFLTYKNALTISLIELFAVAIALRYERFLAVRHSAGLHTSYYIYGHSGFSSYGFGGYYPITSTYTGFKMAPFYRFYPLRKKATGLFIDAKVPFGYFYFDNLEYQYSSSSYRKLSITHSFWTWGFGVSLGVMFAMPKTNHGVINISFGYQYFPMVEGPETLTEEVSGGTILTHTTNTDWWREIGPGSHFEVKFTIGGIF